MPKFLLMTLVGLSAGILFGFMGAAVMATDLGLVIVGAIAALIVLNGVFEGAHMIAQSRA
jgi:hypothetical protein